MSPEQRDQPRRRTRLRSAKIANFNGSFITDCLIHDRSAEGARLRLPEDAAVPDHCLLFDDELQSLHVAGVTWRKPGELGIRMLNKVEGAAWQGVARRLAGKFYAL